MAGPLDMGGNYIGNVSVSQSPKLDDAANIGYVDQKTGEISGAIT
jgi:hypothetical protein